MPSLKKEKPLSAPICGVKNGANKYYRAVAEGCHERCWPVQKLGNSRAELGDF